MSTYIVFTKLKTTNQAELDIYSQKGANALGGFAITPHVVYGNQTIVEGPAHEGIVVMSFPTREEAEGWYHSPAYQDAAQHRKNGAEYSVTIVDGL
jgi:uncharacterized protein (DUF1330 family)